MNINELGGGKPQGIPKGPHFNPSKNNPSGEVRLNQTTEAGSGKRAGVQRLRDPDVVNVIQQLDRSPDVRADLVEQIKAKVASGEYFTREVAEQVAEEILDQN